jgi:murein DD-endopeptidase MepM/ murein hydrolase activator NlpD
MKPLRALLLVPAMFAAAMMVVGCEGASGTDVETTPGEEPTATPGLSGAIPTRTPNANRPSAGYATGEGLPPEGAVPRVTSVDASMEGGEPVEGAEAARNFVAPLNGWAAILDRFGTERPGGFVHGGIDFQLSGLEDSPIYTSCSGMVASVDQSPTHSRYVAIRCNEGKWSTVYAHVGEVLVDVGEGVVAGDTVIARQGEPTIWGPSMLHFELRWDFVPVDPEAWIDFNVRPSFTIPTPTPTATPADRATPAPTPTPIPTAIPGQPTATTAPGQPTATPTPPPTATPTPTVTPTPTPWLQPTATPVPPTSTPTRIPVATPTPTSPAAGPEPTATPPFQIF